MRTIYAVDYGSHFGTPVLNKDEAEQRMHNAASTAATKPVGVVTLVEEPKLAALKSLAAELTKLPPQDADGIRLLQKMAGELLSN